MDIKISAIICTLNRAHYLEKALLSLINQSLPDEQYEIIIVDNGSTDNTKDVSIKYSSKRNIKYLYDPIKGLSQARNTGWQNAKGEYIAFLDDDGLASKNWLEEIINTFEKTSQSPDACGGKIELVWEASRPQWIADSMLKPLGHFDYGNKPFFLERSNRNIGGGNMAFKKNIPELIGYFNTNLGRKGSNLLSNDENDYFFRMRKHGLKIFYNPKIIALHHVTEERTKKNWFSQRYYWQGKSNITQLIDNGTSFISIILNIFINFLVLIRLLLFHVYLLLLCSSNENQIFKNKCDILSKSGYIVQGIIIFKNKLFI